MSKKKELEKKQKFLIKLIRVTAELLTALAALIYEIIGENPRSRNCSLPRGFLFIYMI
jgi:hypothetical protein